MSDLQKALAPCASCGRSQDAPHTSDCTAALEQDAADGDADAIAELAARGIEVTTKEHDCVLFPTYRDATALRCEGCRAVVSEERPLDALRDST